MSTDNAPDLSPLLKDVPEPPPALIKQARIARPVEQGGRRRRRRLAFGGLGVALLIAFGVSPAGSATADLIGDLAGIGEKPALPQPRTVPDTARVIDRGQLADGSRWEVVTKSVKGLEGALCFSVTWPDAGPQDIDSYCTRSTTTGIGNDPPLSGGIQFPPGSDGGPGLMFGFADSPDVATVETIATTADGSTPIPTQAIRVVGEPLEAVGGSFPVVLYLSELSAEDLDKAAGGEQNITVVALNQEGSTLDQHVALVPDLEAEVSQQLTIEILHEFPRELERIDGLGASPLTAEERDELTAPGYSGAKLSEAVDLFEARPEIQREKRLDSETLAGRRGPTLPLIRSGAVKLSSGEMAYYVFSEPFQGGSGHVGIYAVDDLEVIRFEERSGE